MKTKLFLFLVGLFSLVTLLSCSSSDETITEDQLLPESGMKGNAPEFEEHPTTLTGRWYMVKADEAENSVEVPQGEFVITFLDNGYAVISNALQKYLYSSGNYPYEVDGNRITFDAGGDIVGPAYYSYEISDNVMLLSDSNRQLCFSFKKVKHEGDFDDINYAELKYRHTYTDTLVIASHVFYDANDAPFYLIRSIHSNLGDWFEDHAEIEGFQHMEGYEVKAIVWTGYYGSGCVVESDQRLIKILDKQQKKSENIPDKYWKQTTPGWAD